MDTNRSLVKIKWSLSSCPLNSNSYFISDPQDIFKLFFVVFMYNLRH